MSFCEPYRNIVTTSGINYQASKVSNNNLAASLRSLSNLKSSFSHAEDLKAVDTSKIELLSPKTPKAVNQTIDSIFKKVDKKDSSLNGNI